MMLAWLKSSRCITRVYVDVVTRFSAVTTMVALFGPGITLSGMDSSVAVFKGTPLMVMDE